MESQWQSHSIYSGVRIVSNMLTTREVRIWDVKKLQIQSELLEPSSKEIRDIAVDGHRGILYTINSSGVLSLLIALTEGGKNRHTSKNQYPDPANANATNNATSDNCCGPFDRT
jgi:hypothetical protein